MTETLLYITYNILTQSMILPGTGGELLAGFYTDESIQRVRDACDITSVVEGYFPLKKAGTRLKALCPFHNEKTPSFTVNPDLQMFKCFGCGEGGDIFKFVMNMEGLDFREALEALAERCGIQLEQVSQPDGIAYDKTISEKKSLYKINHIAVKYFEDCLHQNISGGNIALDYLTARGFNDHTITTWRLGWAPDSYNGLIDRIAEECGANKDAAFEYAVKAGLLKEGNNGLYDFFRGRVMFPIMDIQHRPIAFGGRVLKEDPEKKVGKYLNSPETALFNKSKVLFGLDSAAKEIRISGKAVVVEGYTDVIMCHQYGIRNVVATLGTALTHEHVRLLRRYADSVAAMFDSDEAGQKATEKAIRIFVEEDMPLEVIKADEIKDACEYLPKNGKDAFVARQESAEDAFSYIMEKYFDGVSIGNIDQVSGAVDKSMEIINLSPNKVKVDMLRKKVAKLAGIAEDSLPQKALQAKKRFSPAEPSNSGKKEWKKDFDRNNKGFSSPEIKNIRIAQPNTHANEAKEKRLIEYMLNNRNWCMEICRIKGPEHFSSQPLRDLAADIYDYYMLNNEYLQAEITIILKQCSNPESSSVLSDIAMGEGPQISEQELAETLHFLKLQQMAEERKKLQHEYRLLEKSTEPEKLETLIKEINLISREIDLLKQKEIPSKLNGSAA